MNSTMSRLISSPFNPIEEFRGEYRCIYADLRNANGGNSSGPLEVDRPWDSHTDDHLGLMDHLGIDKFMVLGFCIAGPFTWNPLKRAPDRVVAAGARPIPDPTRSWRYRSCGWASLAGTRQAGPARPRQRDRALASRGSR